ncbi:hypothetical protein [Actinoplanes sp. L3-i22]|uniref:hypothetical protein n=1 Tax=Actinoplanes sp. L3-i22 TaxID=2836373 RepID=UPI001C7829C0|nr:hypothetical protein [Actinoplanes sp. L3-i22]BCY08305.1 hypothetical protein L3i22_033930 [Actinoplanes sp. L3-i22]
MDARGRRIETSRTLGNLCLIIGFGTAAVIGLASVASVAPYLFAILFVMTGLGLRIEAIVLDAGKSS